MVEKIFVCVQNVAERVRKVMMFVKSAVKFVFHKKLVFHSKKKGVFAINVVKSVKNVVGRVPNVANRVVIRGEK